MNAAADDTPLRAAIERAVHRVAPEADLRSIAPDADLRDAIDLDSMDLFRVLLALHDELHVDIAESEYARMRTMEGCMQVLREKMSGA